MRFFEGDQTHFILQLPGSSRGWSVPRRKLAAKVLTKPAPYLADLQVSSNEWVLLEWDSWTYYIGLSTSYHVPENQMNDVCQTCDCIPSSWGATGSEYEANSCFLKHFCFMGTEWSDPTAVPSCHLRCHRCSDGFQWERASNGNCTSRWSRGRLGKCCGRSRARSLTMIQNTEWLKLLIRVDIVDLVCLVLSFCRRKMTYINDSGDVTDSMTWSPGFPRRASFLLLWFANMVLLKVPCRLLQVQPSGLQAKTKPPKEGEG